MNERSRRHQSRRLSPETNSHSANQYHSQSNSRVVYHGHPADNYSTSNYRHPSTTTTTTDPSSIDTIQSSSGNCAVSMCYLYLIAIISSFLVVLGIYFSLTKFNPRFLYISLIGLSIEAIGACIYCVNNIRTSKLARRKQRVISDDFILNPNDSLGNQNNGVMSDRQQQQQQQITTITHILNNRTLTSNNDNDRNLNENESTAINNDNNAQSNQSQQQTTVVASRLDRQSEMDQHSHNLTSGHGTEFDGQNMASEVASPASDQVDSMICILPAQVISSIDPLPKSEHCQHSPEPNGGDCISSSSLLEYRANSSEQNKTSSGVIEDQSSAAISHVGSGEGQDQVRGQLSNNIVTQFNNHIVDDTGKEKGPTEDSLLTVTRSDNLDVNCNADEEHNETTAKSSLPTNAPNTNTVTDLINLQPQGGGLMVTDVNEPQAVPRRKSSQGQQTRPAHLRMTLVMGLSGEEEMIEVDEEDLDNMSILPPPYESITKTRSN